MGVLYDVYAHAHERYGVTGRPELVVVRPDGYVCTRAALDRAGEAGQQLVRHVARSGEEVPGAMAVAA